MAVWTGLVGPTYTVRAKNVDAERAVNLYCEGVGVADYYAARIVGRDAGGGVTTMALYGVPGLTAKYTFTAEFVSCLFYQDNRTFAVTVSGETATLRELFSDGTSTVRGTMLADTNPATISSNGQQANQLFITSGGLGYIFNLSSNTLTQITDASFLGTTMGGFINGYFLSLVPNSLKFQICNLDDGLNWSTGDAGVATREEGSDNLVALLVDHLQAWCFGSKTSLSYYDSGNTFPFDPVQGSFMEEGCAAPWAAVRFDNTVYWVSQSERGDRVAFRANGYTPVRVSTYAVELAWRQYTTVADAVAYAYELDGHAYWVIYFPTANATWVYDASTQLWHERGLWDEASASYHAYPGRCHCFAWGTTHLVGSPTDGTIYQEDPTVCAFGSNPLRWMRRATHLADELKRMQHHRLQINLQVGQGTTSGQGSAPKIMLRWSNDGAYTWSSEQLGSMGALGNYQTRVFWTQLGQARDRVYEVSGSDPVPVALVTSYLDVTTGLS